MYCLPFPVEFSMYPENWKLAIIETLHFYLLTNSN